MKGEIAEIPGAFGRWIEVDVLYEYHVDKVKCPVCGGLGVPWMGWFTCESQLHIALVDGGRTFVRRTVA